MSGANGYGDEARGHDQICCLVDEGKRCARRAGNASYSKRIQKTVQQRRLKLNIDHSVGTFVFYLTEGNKVITDMI